MLGKRTSGTDELFLAILTVLVVVEDREGVVSEIKSHVNSVLSFSPVGLARSPGQERGL